MLSVLQEKMIVIALQNTWGVVAQDLPIGSYSREEVLDMAGDCYLATFNTQYVADLYWGLTTEEQTRIGKIAFPCDTYE